MRARPRTLPSSTPLFQVLPVEHGRGLRLVGELDLSTVAHLLAALARLPKDADVSTLDLADLSFIDASGLHALEQYAESLDGARPLVLEHASAHVRRLFDVTGMSEDSRIELRDAGDG